LIICLAGLLNFAQSGLDAATHLTFHGNPIPVNVTLLSAALLVGIVLVGFIARKSHKIQRENIEEEAESARESLMPGVNGGARVADYGSMANGDEEENRGRRQ